jgi:translation initiation factor IF-2
MATRTTNKPIGRKTADAKGQTAKPSSAAKPGASTPPKKEVPEPAPVPKVVQETVSLIDAKPKGRRPRTAQELQNKPFAHIPISRILEPEAPKPVTPPPAPVEEAPVEAVVEPEPIEEIEEPKTDEKVIHIKPPIVVKELALQMGLKPFLIISDLMEMNIFASINQTIEPEVASKVCAKHGFTFEKERREKGAGVHKPETKVVAPPKEPEKPKEDELKLRAPIVTFMGHVDHGKTTLMDAIRKTRVAAGEAGGITQHIGAYSVAYKTQRITFLDTPGHAAFSAMRARGANVTDIVVLIVAADDGLMPQTIEAINHAKAAKVQIMVAITKIDVPGANIDKVKGQLQEKGLAPEDWGGETIVCPVSAVKGIGVDDLLESILLVAEVAELKASGEQSARGTVIEAQLEQGRGPTATIIVRTGTLKLGDAFICGNFDGKVKSLIDDLGKPIKSAGPSTPVKVLGFSGLPNAGDDLVVMDSERAVKGAQRRSPERPANAEARHSSARLAGESLRQPRGRSAPGPEAHREGGRPRLDGGADYVAQADRQQKDRSGDRPLRRGSDSRNRTSSSRQRRTSSSLVSM